MNIDPTATPPPIKEAAASTVARLPSESLIDSSPLKAKVYRASHFVIVHGLAGGSCFCERQEDDGVEAFTIDAEAYIKAGST